MSHLFKQFVKACRVFFQKCSCNFGMRRRKIRNQRKVKNRATSPTGSMHRYRCFNIYLWKHADLSFKLRAGLQSESSQSSIKFFFGKAQRQTRCYPHHHRKLKMQMFNNFCVFVLTCCSAAVPDWYDRTKRHCCLPEHMRQPIRIQILSVSTKSRGL